MKRNAALAELSEKNNPHYIVQVAEAYDSNKARIYHKYDVCTMDHHIDCLRSSEPYSYHELISADSPCKIYIDCEGDGLDFSDEQNEAFLTYTKEAMAKAFKACTDTELPDPIVFTASREGKVSFHLTWPVWVKNPLHCKDLVKEAFRDVPYMGVTYDQLVYPQNRHRTLREPYSYKVDKTRYTHRCVPYGVDDKEFNAELYAKACVSYDKSKSSEYEFDEIGHVYEWSVTPGSRVGDKERSEQDKDYEPVNQVIEYFKRFNPMTVSDVTVYKDQSFVFRATGMFCRIAGRVHKSNGMYVNGASDGTIRMTCTDCPDKTVLYEDRIDSIMLMHKPIVLDKKYKKVRYEQGTQAE